LDYYNFYFDYNVPDVPDDVLDGALDDFYDLDIHDFVHTIALDSLDSDTYSSDYNYYDGLSEIVEKIRKYLNPTGATKSPNDSNGMFDGSIKPKPNTNKDSKEPKDYYIEWVLFIDDEYVSDIKGTIIPKPATEEDKIFKIKVKKPKKGAKKIIPKKKIEAPKTEPSFSSKEIIDIEKAKQKTMTLVLKLIKAGYSKKEINKLLNIK